MIRNQLAGTLFLWLLVCLTATASPSRDPFSHHTVSTTINSLYGLDDYAVNSFTLLGILKQQNETIAVIRDPQQRIYSVRVGYNLGLEHATVTKISSTEVWLEWWLQQNKMTRILTLAAEN